MTLKQVRKGIKHDFKYYFDLLTRIKKGEKSNNLESTFTECMNMYWVLDRVLLCDEEITKLYSSCFEIVFKMSLEEHHKCVQRIANTNSYVLKGLSVPDNVEIASEKDIAHYNYYLTIEDKLP